MLLEHRQAFLTLTDEVTALVQTNRELLVRGQKAVREVLASIGDGRVEVGAGYGGRPAHPSTAATSSSTRPCKCPTSTAFGSRCRRSTPSARPSRSPARTSPTSTPRGTPASGSSSSPTPGRSPRPSSRATPARAWASSPATPPGCATSSSSCGATRSTPSTPACKESQSVLSRIELAFDEPSDDGLSKLIAGFLAAFDDVANNPDDLAARAQLVEQGQDAGRRVHPARRRPGHPALVLRRGTGLPRRRGQRRRRPRRRAEPEHHLGHQQRLLPQRAHGPARPADRPDGRTGRRSPSARRRTAPSTSSSAGPPSSGAARRPRCGSRSAPTRPRPSGSRGPATATRPASPARPAGLLGAVNDVIPRYRDGLAGGGPAAEPTTSTPSTAPASPSTARPGSTSS